MPGSDLRHFYYRFRAWLGRPRVVRQVQPVLVGDEDVCEDPIFVVGVHRSGTSLMRRIVNSHSRLACPSESYFLVHFVALLEDEKTADGFEGMGFERSQVTTEIRKWASRYHEAFRLSQGKARWADKTPQYVAILPQLEAIFGQRSQYVMVLRNPLDILYSQWKRGWAFGNFHDDLLLNNAYYVADSIEKIVDFGNRYPTRCHQVYYERLVTNPETELKKLVEFLGEPWEASLLNYHEQAHGFGVEDPIVRGTKGFVKNFANWRAFSDEQLSQVTPILRNAMDMLQYKMGQDYPCE